MKIRTLLRGAIDTHVHSYPDVIPRKVDDLQLVAQARRAGMRALVLKSHVSPTCARAYLLNRWQSKVRVFGGLALNDTVGGLNPRAVETTLAMGGVQIWMPTISAANHRRHFGGRGGLTVLRGGKLRAEVREILGLVAEARAILATGHLAPEEASVLVEEAVAAGVRAISVTHPEWGVTAMPVRVQQRLAASGAVFFERCLVATQPDLRCSVPFSTIVQQIRAVGVGTTILATDFGMPQYPTPVEGMRSSIQQLAEAGFSHAEIKRMVQVNPARILQLT